MESEVKTLKPNLLKSKRAITGLTQKEVADEAGWTEKTYNHKETGKVECKVSDIITISSILNLTIIDVNEIFFDNNLPNGNKRISSI